MIKKQINANVTLYLTEETARRMAKVEASLEPAWAEYRRLRKLASECWKAGHSGDAYAFEADASEALYLVEEAVRRCKGTALEGFI